jgi:hypothetical protein
MEKSLAAVEMSNVLSEVEVQTDITGFAELPMVAFGFGAADVCFV